MTSPGAAAAAQDKGVSQLSEAATAEQERWEGVHLSRGGNCRTGERGGGQSSFQGWQLQKSREGRGSVISQGATAAEQERGWWRGL